MKLDYVLFCDSATQSEDGKVSAIGLFDRIYASQFPAVHTNMAFVFRIGAITDPHIKIVADIVRKTTNDVIGTFEAEADVDLARTQRHQVVLSAKGLPFLGEGDYLLKVKVNGVELGSDTFSVMKTE